jgi:3-isopropylmalate dehydratase small subunit
VSERELILLAKIEGDTLVPCDNIIRLRFKKRIDPKIIQNNLFYHLKYNTVSQDVLNFKAVKTTLGFTSDL